MERIIMLYSIMVSMVTIYIAQIQSGLILPCAVLLLHLMHLVIQINEIHIYNSIHIDPTTRKSRTCMTFSVKETAQPKPN